MNSFVVLIHILSVIGSLTTSMTVCVHRLSVNTETLSCAFALTMALLFATNTLYMKTVSKQEVCTQLCLDWGHKEKLKIGIQGCRES